MARGGGKHHYPDAPAGQPPYFKPTLARDTPSGILNYAAGNPGFPHQSTADQCFDESQFESYRKLGHCIAARVFDDTYREIFGNDYNTGQDVPYRDWTRLFQTLQARASVAFRKQTG